MKVLAAAVAAGALGLVPTAAYAAGDPVSDLLRLSLLSGGGLLGPLAGSGAGSGDDAGYGGAGGGGVGGGGASGGAAGASGVASTAAAATGAAGTLARTGVPASAMTGYGAAMLVGGVVILYVTRPRGGRPSPRRRRPLA